MREHHDFKRITDVRGFPRTSMDVSSTSATASVTFSGEDCARSLACLAVSPSGISWAARLCCAFRGVQRSDNRDALIVSVSCLTKEI